MSGLPSNYTLINKLGEQKQRKFGDVYLAKDDISGKNVVVKTIQKTTANKHLAERLRRESTFNFDIRGLPSILYFHENEQEVLLIKQYVHGITLDHYWKTVTRKQKLESWKKIIYHLSPLLEELRTSGIVHCDLKPSNLLIDETPESFQIHLLDFGMALRLSEHETRSTLFPLGYAAPELILNQLSCINHTTDLFSLGIITWQLFTGVLPLSHPHPAVFTNLQITHPIPEHSSIPKEINVLLKKMCYKHLFSLPPNQLGNEEVISHLKNANSKRFQSMEEILPEIDGIKNKSFWEIIGLIKIPSKPKIN